MCGKEFHAWRPKDDKTNCCSIKCKSEYVRKKHSTPKAKRLKRKRQRLLAQKRSIERMSKALAAAETQQLSPKQSAKIRLQIANLVQRHIEIANGIILGEAEVKWGPSQSAHQTPRR